MPTYKHRCTNASKLSDILFSWKISSTKYSLCVRVCACVWACVHVISVSLKGLGRPVLNILSGFPWGLLVRTDPCWRLTLSVWITVWAYVCMCVCVCFSVCMWVCVILRVYMYWTLFVPARLLCSPSLFPRVSPLSYHYFLPDNHPLPKTPAIGSQDQAKVTYTSQRCCKTPR